MQIDAYTSQWRCAPAALALRGCTVPASVFAAALFAAALAVSPRPAVAEGDGGWANESLRKMAAWEGNEDRGARHHHGRASALARSNDTEVDDDDIRASRRVHRTAFGDGQGGRRGERARRERRVASLSHEIVRAPTDSPAVAPVATIQPPQDSAAAPAPGTVVASLGLAFVAPSPVKPPDLSVGHINWVASAACLALPLRGVLAEVAALFGPVRVNSTCRSKRHNAQVGGAPRSYHLTGSAVDFRVTGHFKAVHAFLSGKKVVGGLKHYGSGVFHIDTGPRRTWGSRRRHRA
jgi:Peptidase M15